MRSIISFSIVTSTLLLILSTLFLFWTPASPKSINAAVINAPALTADKASEPTLTTVSTTTDVTVPTELTEAQPKDILVTTELPVETTEVIKVTPPQAPPLAPPQTAPKPINLASLVHSLTNAARGQNNRAELSFDSKLSELAKERSEEMILQNYFSHTSLAGCDLNCRFSSAKYETMTLGENLAESTSYQMLSSQELAEMFMGLWLKSTDHRDNLLSKQFTHEGIGIASKGGRIVVTVVFAAL